MRILIPGPPKSGNARLRCLLATAYGLHSESSRDVPDEHDGASILSWLTEFPEQTVVAVAFRHHDDLVKTAAERGIQIVPIVRHPFDLFLSSIEVGRSRALRGRARGNAPAAIDADQSLDGPAALDFARGEFASDIASLAGWHKSGLPVVRFEDLEAHPADAMVRLARTLGPLSANEVDRALSICPAESVILGRPERGNRMPALPSGSWRDQLPEATLRVLRDRYEDLVRQLGYESA